MDDENILASALTDVAILIEGNPLIHPVVVRFHRDELAVHILTADFRHRRKRIRGDSPP